MQFATIQPPTNLAISQPVKDAFLATEVSVLAIIAVLLIKGIWSEHRENEKAERQLTDKLVDALIEKRNAN